MEKSIHRTWTIQFVLMLLFDNGTEPFNHVKHKIISQYDRANDTDAHEPALYTVRLHKQDCDKAAVYNCKGKDQHEHTRYFLWKFQEI